MNRFRSLALALMAASSFALNAGAHASAPSEGFPAAFNAQATAGATCESATCARLPRLLEGEAPRYPVTDLWVRKQGRIVVEYRIEADGRVSAPRVRWANSTAMRDSVLQAIADWRFEPAMVADKPQALDVRQTFVFKFGTQGAVVRGAEVLPTEAS